MYLQMIYKTTLIGVRHHWGNVSWKSGDERRMLQLLKSRQKFQAEAVAAAKQLVLAGVDARKSADLAAATASAPLNYV